MTIECYYVYILRSTFDQNLYIGFTTDLRKRLKAHAAGGVRSTKNRGFMKLIHYEYFINKKDAMAREIFLKSGYGHRQIEVFLGQTLKISKNSVI
jgi:putative endonuclease